MIEGIWQAYSVLAAICALGLAVTLLGEFLDRTPLVAAGKFVAASAYMSSAFALGAPYNRYGRILLAAMLFCWLGDLLLVSRNSRRLFVAGLAAFLIGHLFYAGAFIERGITLEPLLAGFVILVIFSWRVVAWLKPHLDQRMQAPVYLYIAAICLMMLMAAGTAKSPGARLVIIGAAMFVVSDLFVARNRFIKPGFENRAMGLPLYFSAQLALAATVAL